MNEVNSVRTVKLGDVCEKIGSGITPRGGSSVYQDQGTALIRSQNVYNSEFTKNGLAFLSDEIAERMKGVAVHSRDVLLNITGDSVARICLVPEDVLPARVNQHVAIIRPDQEKLWPEYLSHFLVSPFMQTTLLSWAGSGGTRKALTKTMLESFEIPLPEIEVQKRISDVLSTYNHLIENNRRRIALLEDAARLLYREWFVHFRFPGHEHVKVVDGVPEGWATATLGEIAETNPESYKAKELPEELNYIDISSVTVGTIQSKTPMNAGDAPGRARRIARDGDVIWSNVRPNLRAYSLVMNPEPIDVFSTGFTVLRAKKVPFSYLYCLVTTDAFVGHLVNHATGAGYPAVRPDDFERAEVVLPASNLLDEYHEFALPIFRQKEKLMAQSRELAKARDLLLPRLMDGRIEV